MKRYTVTPEHIFYDSVVALSSSLPDGPSGESVENPFYRYSYGMDEPDAPVKYTAVIRVPGPVVRKGELNPETYEVAGEQLPPEFNGRVATIADTPEFNDHLIVTLYEDEREFRDATQDEQDKAAEYGEALLLPRVNNVEGLADIENRETK